MDSIIANGTWEVTDLPSGYKPVGCKWIFKRKRRPDGTIEKNKARLVAKGFTQKKVKTTLTHILSCGLFTHNLGAFSTSCHIQTLSTSNRCKDRFPKWRVG